MRRRWLWVVVPVFVVGLGVGGYRAWQWALAPREGPLIGVSTDTAWHSWLGLTTSTYETAVLRAGGRVVMFQPGDEAVDTIIEQIDGLLLAGGGDVDPRRYGGDPAQAQMVDATRDAFDVALIERALARDMPILGVCRGLQVLNVADGGTLRNIRADRELGRAHGGRLSGDHTHPVQLVPQTRLARIIGSSRTDVNSYHGQAIARLGGSLQVAGRADDGVVEAVEWRDRRFVVGTQWHPEILSLSEPKQLALFRQFVAEAGAYAARKARPRSSQTP